MDSGQHPHVQAASARPHAVVVERASISPLSPPKAAPAGEAARDRLNDPVPEPIGSKERRYVEIEIIAHRPGKLTPTEL